MTEKRDTPAIVIERATGVPEAPEYVFECSCDDGDTRKCSHRPHDGGPCECSCHKDPPGVPAASDSRKTVDIGKMLDALNAMNPRTPSASPPVAEDAHSESNNEELLSDLKVAIQTRSSKAKIMGLKTAILSRMRPPITAEALMDALAATVMTHPRDHGICGVTVDVDRVRAALAALGVK